MDQKDKKGLLSLKENNGDIQPIGRPPKFTDLNKLQTDIDNYFQQCAESKTPLTIYGLADALGIHRDTLHAYENEYAQINHFKPFSDVIKRAKQRIITSVIQKLLTPGQATTGAIFWLKNAADWADKQEVDTKHTITIRIEDSTNKTANALEISHKDSE